MGLNRSGWSPELLRLALMVAVEIPSYARAAKSYTELMRVPMSASTMKRLVRTYGSEVVEADEREAEAMVRVPKEEEEVSYRRIPEPDSEVMAVSAEGVMVHLREEGWKEAKVAAVSAVPVREAGAKTEEEVRLTKHSCRAGLWDAKRFTNHYWAESCRRGVEKAKRLVCVNDGAIWIWAIVFVCFSRCIEILDWRHMLHHVWQIANQAMEPASAEASAWVKAQKAALARGQLGLFFSHILRLYPKLGDAPPEVKQAVAYLWKNRRRMHYAAYRKAGLPISSGTVESAAKTLVQQRMKQSGMRWSRDGAQAMLALRARLLSDRWHEVPI